MLAILIAIALATGVEATEAATLILAAGRIGGWRPALAGTCAALVILITGFAAAGTSIRYIPVRPLELVTGLAAAYMGQSWLRKAIARQLGRKAKQDEEKVYAAAVREKKPALALAFQGTLTEGTEILLILVTMGARVLWQASLAACASILLITGMAMAIRGPLTRIPENTFKMLAGTILLVMGVAWTGEALHLW